MADHVTAENLNLRAVQKHFGFLGFEVVLIEQKWRHITGRLRKDGQDLFLKLASTTGIAARTKNEAAWNNTINRKPAVLPVKVPRVMEEGVYEDLFWFVSEFVDGKELAKATDRENVTNLEEKMELVAETAVAILKLSGLNLLPKDVDDPLEPVQEKFLENIKGWMPKIETDVSDLYEFILKNIESLEIAPFHGDFVPWHFILTKSGELFLVDAEAARIKGIKLYDTAFFYHRTYTKLKRPDLANRFLKLFIERYQMSEKEKLGFRVVLAQRLIGGTMDAQSDGITSAPLQNELRAKLIHGEILS